MPAWSISGQDSLPGWQKAIFSLCPHTAGTESKSKSSGVSSYEVTNPIMGVPLSWHNYLPKSSPPNSGLGFQPMNLREGHNSVQAGLFPKKQQLSCLNSFCGSPVHLGWNPISLTLKTLHYLSQPTSPTPSYTTPSLSSYWPPLFLECIAVFLVCFCRSPLLILVRSNSCVLPGSLLWHHLGPLGVGLVLLQGTPIAACIPTYPTVCCFCFSY